MKKKRRENEQTNISFLDPNDISKRSSANQDLFQQQQIKYQNRTIRLKVIYGNT